MAYRNLKLLEPIVFACKIVIVRLLELILRPDKIYKNS